MWEEIESEWEKDEREQQASPFRTVPIWASPALVSSEGFEASLKMLCMAQMMPK